MSTALAATFEPGDTSGPAAVRLEVTGAPTLTPPYASNFDTTDGWAASSGASVAVYPSYPRTLRLLTAPDVAYSTFTRTVTGLTVGQTYRLTVTATRSSGRIALSVGGTTTSWFSPTAPQSVITADFVATGTSHTASVFVSPPATIGTDVGEYRIGPVKVTRVSDWQGTTITRTDANGTAPVREAAAGQDTDATGHMLVLDYEAALVGPVTYVLTDGDGTETVAELPAQDAPGVWLTLPGTADPALPWPPEWVRVDLLMNYTENKAAAGALRRPIGRRDPIGNPGPLSLRTGSFDLWCADYATAMDVRTMLEGGATALLRQPDHRGLDLYFRASAVTVNPLERTTPQRWSVAVTFDEMQAPTTDTAVVILDGGAP